MTNEEGSKSQWCLAINIKDREQVINDYTRRMWIEESFKDLKGILKWERYTKKVPKASRIEKMVIISILSYSLRLSMGSDIEVPPSEEKKTSIIKRFQYIIVSAYRKMDEIFRRFVTFFRVRYYRLAWNFV